MYHLTVPFTSLTLSLSPRWGEAPGPWQVVFWVLLAVAPIALILWLARYELRLISRPAAAGLLVLRLVVLFLIWNLVCLQPVVAYPTTPKVRERVLVAVDVSGSMGVTDPERPPVEKLRLARALHLARDVCPDLQLDQWIEQSGPGKEPQWVSADEYRDEPERRRQLEAERRRQHDVVCKRVDELTRGKIARLVLADEGAGLLHALSERYDVEVVAFAGASRAIGADQLDALERPAVGSLGEYTDLNLPLRRGLETSGALRGVVVLTDGQHNPMPVGADVSTPVALAEKLRERQVPVYAVGLGASRVGLDRRAPAPPDVAVAVVRAPDAVLRPRGADNQQASNTNVSVEAVVRVTGLPAQDIPVELLQDGKQLEQRVIHHNGKDQDYPVSFSASLTKEGTQQLTVKVPPIPGEGYPGNNSRSVSVKVVEDVADVLLIDGEARWEYHYLATALERDPLVHKPGGTPDGKVPGKLPRIVFEQPRLQKATDADLEAAGYPARQLPGKDPGLAPYDCIVLGDVSPEQLPLAERQRLEDYVANRGGTLVIVAGRRYMPQAFPAAGAEVDPLAKLLPVEKLHVLKPQTGFPLTLTSDGRQTPLMQMDDNPFLQTEDDVDAGRSGGRDVQRHYWAVAGQVKPGATVLAYYAGDGKPDRAARRKQQEEQALIVRQTYGRGRVLYVGIDSTWRWRYKVGDRLHHQFWGQLVRWAAADKLVEGGNEQVRFGATKANYAPGEQVNLIVRLDQKLAPLTKDSPARVRVLRRQGDKEEVVAVVPLTRREAQSRVLDGALRDLPPGDYRLELDVPELADKVAQPAPGTTAPREARFSITPPESKEMTELSTDWDQLEGLANASAGRAFTAQDASTLVNLLVKKDQLEEKRPENRLWEWWPTLALLLLLLTLEWGGRKLAGLP